MAATAITNVTLKLNTGSAAYATAAVHADDGALVTAVADQKMLILFENATSATKVATIKAGNGLQGVSDITVSLGNVEKKAIVVESMKFVNQSGTNKGKILITGTDANVKVACIALP